MSAIDWRRLTQPEFDKVVEAFFAAEHHDIPQDAFAVNGRGGDQGIDIQVRRDGKLTIVQLKCFPEGFSGGFADVRRGEIRESFKTALQHDPDEWWLVVPTTLTRGERGYVEGLLTRNAKGRTKPSIVICDAPRLDALAARHLDLVTYFKRDELREAAKDFGAEQALLIDQEDLLARVAALSKQGDTLDPDWRLEFFTRGDLVGSTIVAKHPHAAERSPITLTINTVFSPDQEDLRAAFNRAMSFGTPDRIDLPSSAVSSFVVDGPEFVAESRDNVEVSWWPAETDQEPVQATIVSYDEKGKSTASFPGVTTWRGAASAGASLNAKYCNTITLQFLLPFDTSKPVSMSVRVELAGASPADIVAGVTLLERLEAAPGVGIELDGKQLARLLTSGEDRSPFGADRESILLHRDIAVDLVEIQRETSRHFAYPQEVSFDELVYVRCLRLLLEGKCVVLPGERQITPVLDGENSEQLRLLLAGEAVTMVSEIEDFGMNLLGQDIYVGMARVYAPQIVAVDPAAALDALEAGSAAGYALTLRPANGYGFWVFLPERYVEEPDGVVRPIGLGIEGVSDAADVARALETVSEAPSNEAPEG